VNAQLSAAKATGGRVGIPSGQYLSSGWLLDNSAQTADAPDDPRQVTLEGDGPGSTIINAITPGVYALKILGGLKGRANSLNYSPVGGFTIARRAQPLLGSRGLWLSGVGFGRVRDIYATNIEKPVYLESVLSTAFDDVIVASATNGIEIGKGQGYTNFNGNVFKNLQLRLIDKFALYGGPVTNLTINSMVMQGVGTQGDAASGGMNLTFNGDEEGGAGLSINGAYVENNSGEADFVLTNLGKTPVTHVIQSASFNRITGAKYVRTHLKLVGRHHVVFIGAAFNSYNDYQADESRPLFDYDANISTITCIGCTGLNRADNTTGVQNLR
jgi:hypothetical protein